MRIIHTSDWHIGRTFHGSDLKAAHQHYFAHLLELVDRTQPAAVLVSGDVYDRAIPPVESVELLHGVIRDLTDRTHVILTAGNHDSATRLGFFRGLTIAQLHLRTSVRDAARPVILNADGVRTAVFALPYLSVDNAQRELSLLFGEPPARSHQAVMDAAVAYLQPRVEQARTEGADRVMVAAHTFIQGARAADSERDIRVGGVDCIAADTFDPLGADYVALGHLHRPQDVTGAASRTRYSGSPIAFSFSETRDEKSTSIVQLTANSEVKVELIAAPVLHPLVQLRGRIDDVLAENTPAHAWVRVTLTDPLPPPRAWHRLAQRFGGLKLLDRDPEGLPVTPTLPHVRGQDGLEVLEQFVQDVSGQQASPAMVQLLQQAWEAANAEAANTGVAS